MISKMPPPAVELSVHHQRILRSQLCHLDDRLEELDRILVDANGSCSSQGGKDLGADQLAAARDRIGQLRETMTVFAHHWQIDMTRFAATPSQLALVHLAFLLVDLDELSPAALRGYGAVGAAFVEDYEALLVKLYGGLEKVKRDIRPTRSLTDQG